MKREINLFERSLFYTVPLTVIFALVLHLVAFNEAGEVKSLVVGVTASIVLNYCHITITEKLAKENYKKLKGFTIFSYIFRYFIYATLLVLGCIFASFNVVFMVIGYIEYPIILMIVSFTTIKKE